MRAGGPVGEDSHHARKLQIREAHDISLKEVLDVEAMEDAPLIQFRRAKRSGPKTSHNDALVITALLANYELGRIFIDSGSSADILFGEAYGEMQLGTSPLKMNTSLYGFTGEVIHHRGMISLPLTLETENARRACMLKFLVVDVPSAYNVILGRPTLNAFQAVISTYHIRSNFLPQAGSEKFKGTPSNLVSVTSKPCTKDRKEPLTRPPREIWTQKKSLKRQERPLRSNQ
ncbi:UNVERIFIED_CONTAM: hypothetical protein Slati_3724100 [Sesamum latifolium]|uniref:Uncharacterized protein n=1 Tax=Sesamum latifolium TaxID=2727402 RepID=A0AAW2U3B3_9LAMI